MSTPTLELSQSREKVLQAVDEAAEMWGAEWQPTAAGGTLRLPVVQGIRHGVVQATLRIESVGSKTSLHCDIEETFLTLNKSALAILLLGGLGGITVILWPLSPKILQLAPIGAVLALVAWLLVVSRLRNSDLNSFLEVVADLAEHL